MTTTRNVLSKALVAAEYAVGIVLGVAATAGGFYLTGFPF